MIKFPLHWFNGELRDNTNQPVYDIAEVNLLGTQLEAAHTKVIDLKEANRILNKKLTSITTALDECDPGWRNESDGSAREAIYRAANKLDLAKVLLEREGNRNDELNRLRTANGHLRAANTAHLEHAVSAKEEYYRGLADGRKDGKDERTNLRKDLEATRSEYQKLRQSIDARETPSRAGFDAMKQAYTLCQESRDKWCRDFFALARKHGALCTKLRELAEEAPLLADEEPR